jgi:uncharacterized membrane-anchored protein YitT (DUF2179 family)
MNTNKFPTAKFLFCVAACMMAAAGGQYLADLMIERGLMTEIVFAALLNVVVVIMAYHKLDRLYVTRLTIICVLCLMSMCIIQPMGELKFDNGVQPYLIAVLIFVQMGLYCYAVGSLAGATSAAIIINSQRRAV